jgi:hypothetical protein
MEQETPSPVMAEEPVQEAVSTTAAAPIRACLNCETQLTDVFCPHCGQKDIPARQTIKELLENFISSFWSFESKFLNTGRSIFTKPGQLPKDYNQGKRERYYHPARMYVFISFVFFLFIEILPDQDASSSPSSDKSNQITTGWAHDSVATDLRSFEKYDSIQKTLPEGKRDHGIARYINQRVAELNDRYNRNGESFTEAYGAAFFGNISRVFFVLLPLFALLLKLFYIRRDFYYSEHLVFSIYYYNFFFLAGSIYMLVDLIPYGSSVSWIMVTWMFLYLLFAMKRMYGQSWRKTIFKYGTFLVIFSFCIAIGLVANAVLTFLII